MHALNAAGFDLDLTGFDGEDLDRLLASLDEDGNGDAVAGEDVIPEPPDDPVSRPGDLWLLGEHRRLCGDSTRADDVVRLLAGSIPNLMVTDPPYGVSYDPAWRNDAGVAATARTGTVRNDDRADWRDAWGCSPAMSRTSGTPAFTGGSVFKGYAYTFPVSGPSHGGVQARAG